MAESGFPLPPEDFCALCADTLRDPVTIPCGDTYCLECITVYWDQFDHMGVYRCPQCRATYTPRPALKRNLPDKVLVVTQSEVQYIIQERMKELQELRHNVEVLKSGAQRAQAESDKTFHEMLQAVERWKAEIHQMITANMQSAMSQAEGYVDRLEQEIQELQRRDAELRQILETEDNIHFLQNFPTLCIPPEAMVPKVLINPQFSFGEMSKTATEMKEHLDDICKKELSKISKTVSETPVYILLPRNGDKRLKVPSRVDFQEPKTRMDFLRYTCKIDLPEAPRATRIGVYLDYAGNTVAFYSVSETMALIHRFKAQFSEPLYAGVGVGSSVTLCQLKRNAKPY
ncbi:E3 ubiquitin-protein ligase TRIM31 [Dissostichus eleginoides]|uniref:E3 ubiquitin-protein ligase TRIM31 n=1 Tax=Dissostichus eleginoides TaxID=100907 RepID=A0AAD9BRQ0_DISEL|nr:E3 ubiquitin-protein ligase TRIM31 [Dissostichus eleginoides]